MLPQRHVKDKKINVNLELQIKSICLACDQDHCKSIKCLLKFGLRKQMTIIKLLFHLNFLKNIYTKLFKMANTERFAQKPQWPLKKK